METAVGVSSLLKSLITIYRLIREQGAQYAESPHKERQTDRLEKATGSPFLLMAPVGLHIRSKTSKRYNK